MGHLFVTLGEDKSLPLFYWLEAVHFFLNLCWLVKNSAQSVHCCIAVQQTKYYRKSRVTLWKDGGILKWTVI